MWREGPLGAPLPDEAAPRLRRQRRRRQRAAYAQAAGADAADALTFYRDGDGDSYGDASSTTAACSAPSGYVADATDCDDGNATTYPGADETCDGEDDQKHQSDQRAHDRVPPAKPKERGAVLTRRGRSFGCLRQPTSDRKQVDDANHGGLAASRHDANGPTATRRRVATTPNHGYPAASRDDA